MFKIKKFTFQFILLLFSVLIISCEQQIVEPKVCNAPPNLGFTEIDMQVQTDTTTFNFVIIDPTGVIMGDNFIIKYQNVKRNAKFGGTICADGNFTINILYNDTVVNSRLQLRGHYDPNICSGNFYYSPNQTDTTFTNIGDMNVSPGSGTGGFDTPIFSGELHCTVKLN